MYLSRNPKPYRYLIAVAAFIFLSAIHLFASDFAFDLLKEGLYKESALEFRRLSYSATNDSSKAVWYIFSAYAYKEAAEFNLALSSLDRSEAFDVESLEEPIMLLRADVEYAKGNYPEAAFYYFSLEKSGSDKDISLYASEGYIASLLRDGKISKAVKAAENIGNGELLAPLGRYETMPKKRPWLGGVMGIIPGMGYLYSGEYGNFVRSLILNGLFAWAMCDTAKDEEWGLFGVATFFELTWYSGSIYGGIDAAKRYNKEALDIVTREIRRHPAPEPSLSMLPVMAVKFGF